MELVINGKAQEFDATQVLLEEVLKGHGYTDSFVAIAVNQTCVPRSQFGAFLLAHGDEVEILAPMSGG